MSYSYEDSLLIVGGGIAGSALGRALQRRDLPFRIVERRRTPADGGLAINLPGNAIQALSALGLRDQIEKFGHPLRRREYRTARDKLVFEVDEDVFWGPALRPRSIRRSALLSMLTDGLPEASLIYDADVKSMTLHSTHAELGLTDGTNLAARLVVGADGVRSTIRTEAFGAALGPGHALLAEKSWRVLWRRIQTSIAGPFGSPTKEWCFSCPSVTAKSMGGRPIRNRSQGAILRKRWIG